MGKIAGAEPVEQFIVEDTSPLAALEAVRRDGLAAVPKPKLENIEPGVEVVPPGEE